MRLRVIALAAALASLPATACWGAPLASDLPAPQPKAVYVGSGACSSPACHGGAETASRWNSSYTVWATRDKHSRAYSILFDAPACQIVRRLDHLPAGSPVKPNEDGRCLGCHSLVQNTLAASEGLHADGVGCEACHGPASHWLVPHTMWPKLSDQDERQQSGRRAKESLGLVDTRDAREAAERCVKCHVGAPRQTKNDLASRDMNHDYIAAGHPRLDFELTSYLAHMPRHWDYAIDEARAWRVGQAVTARAAVTLLADRAQAADEKLTRSRPAVWPELSEYECYGCHHQLSQPSYRQQWSLASPGGSRRPAGRLHWATWYLPVTQSVAQRETGVKLESLNALARLMAEPYSDRTAVAAAANEACLELDKLTAALAVANLDGPSRRRLMHDLARQGATASTWDEAAQLYLALVALDDSRRLTAAGAPPATSPVHGDLQKLFSSLQFPTLKPPLQSASPAGLRPEAFQRVFQDVADRLGR